MQIKLKFGSTERHATGRRCIFLPMKRALVAPSLSEVSAIKLLLPHLPGLSAAPRTSVFLPPAAGLSALSCTINPANML